MPTIDVRSWLEPIPSKHPELQFPDARLYDSAGFIKGIERLNELKSFAYGFSTRKFGNMGIKYGRAEKVIQNRKEFLGSMNLKLEDVVFMKPNHKTNIKVVGSAERGKGALSVESGVGPADALITFEKGVALGLNSADCVPMIFVSKNSGVLALVHAGRIGTDARITAKVVRKLSSLGVNPKDLIVGIGPSVQKNCYKLDFLETSTPTMWLPWVKPVKQSGIEIEENVDGSSRIKAEKGKIAVDVIGYNVQQLIESGVDPDNIDLAPVCSTCFAKKGELFSHSLSNLYKKSHLYPEGRFMAVAVLQ